MDNTNKWNITVSDSEIESLIESVGVNKQKKQKTTVNELLLKQLDLLNKIRKCDSELIELEKEYEKSRKEIISNRKKKNRELYKLTKRLPKLQQNEIDTAKKIKRKRKGPNSGGFNKPLPIPKILIKYLNLDANTKLPRPKVMSLLSNKFKECGLKNGRKIIFDKSTAKVFGKDKGYVIEFKDQQPFLKEIYIRDKNHIDL